MQLHMVDVVGQYARIQEEVDAAVLEVVRSGQFINGPAVHDFTRHLADWLGHTEAHPLHVIPCANGTDALQAAFMALGIGPGDEVITTPYTFFATVGSISRLGATPVLVDIDPTTYNMDVLPKNLPNSPLPNAT